MESIKKIKEFARKYWPYLAGITLAAVIATLFLVFRQDSETETGLVQTTSTISTGDIRISAFGSGTLIASEELQVGFEYGGIVKEVLVEAGDTVQEGDVLAVLQDEELVVALAEAQANLRELTSDAGLATAALDLAQAQKDVLTAQSTLSFYLSPYVFKSELRLREAQEELNATISEASENPSEEAEQRVADAQRTLDIAELSLEMNWKTYYAEYVPDFFNFPWRDRFGFWHDYYDPPSEIEVEQVWAELAAAQASVEEARYYLDALTTGVVSDEAYGSMVTTFEQAVENVAKAQDELDATELTAPMDGIVLEINLTEEESVGTDKVITVARLEPPLLEVTFDEGDWSLVKEGSPVEISFDALPEKVYEGDVIFVDPSLQESFFSSAVSALVEMDLTGTNWAGLPLSSGANIELIAGETRDAVLLPIEGLQEDQGDQGTVIVISEGEYTVRDVELGLRDVLFVEVLDGLNAGDVVLIGEPE